MPNCVAQGVWINCHLQPGTKSGSVGMEKLWIYARSEDFSNLYTIIFPIGPNVPANLICACQHRCRLPNFNEVCPQYLFILCDCFHFDIFFFLLIYLCLTIVLKINRFCWLENAQFSCHHEMVSFGESKTKCDIIIWIQYYYLNGN